MCRQFGSKVTSGWAVVGFQPKGARGRVMVPIVDGYEQLVASLPCSRDAMIREIIKVVSVEIGERMNESNALSS